MVDQRVLKTIIAEAGGDPEAMAAVAAVINNRAQAQGKTPLQVVKAKGQFEGYSNPGPAISRQLNDTKLLQRAEQVFTGVSTGRIADPTNGATMYHADYISPYWAQSANKNGTVNIGGNVFYRGTGSPQTAVAAIDAIAPNPQARPPALGYASTPTSVRAISVNPNGSPASLLDALTAKYGSATATPRGASGASVSGLSLPEAMPVPRVASTVPTIPQALISHPVQTLRMDPMTNKVIIPNAPPSLQAALEAKANRIASGREQFTSAIPTPSRPSNAAPAILKTTAQAGNVALPAGVVPKSVQRDMATLNAMQANRSGSPDDRSSPASGYQPAPANGYIMPSAVDNGALYTTAMTGWNGPLGKNITVPPLSPQQVASIPSAKGTILSGKDQSRLPALPPTAYVPVKAPPAGVAAINAATNPFGGAIAGGALRSLPTVPVPKPYSAGAIPLTKFNTVNPGSQVIPRMQSGFNSTGLGHILQAVNGEPIQGGLLGMLFNPGGLLARPNTGTAPSVPQQVVAPPGNAFLQAQGVNTNGMSLGQQQSALMDSIRGAGGGAWH